MKKKKNAVVNYENKSLCFSKVLDGASGGAALMILLEQKVIYWIEFFILLWIYINNGLDKSMDGSQAQYALKLTIAVVIFMSNTLIFTFDIKLDCQTVIFPFVKWQKTPSH